MMKVQFFIKKCRKEKTNMNKKDLIDYLSDIPSKEVSVKKMIIDILEIDKSKIYENDKLIRKEMLKVMSVVSKNEEFSIKYAYLTDQVETILFLS
ncbi:hypothetical protein [Enterococcus faecalis]|jgi:hypothetical protein